MWVTIQRGWRLTERVNLTKVPKGVWLLTMCEYHIVSLCLYWCSSHLTMCLDSRLFRHVLLACLLHPKHSFKLGPNQYGIFGTNAGTDIREQANSDIWYIRQYYIMTAELGFQILVTKICNGGRISYILTNFISNVSPNKSKHFTHQLLNNLLPSAGQTI